MQKSIAKHDPPPVTMPLAHQQLYFEFFQEIKEVCLKRHSNDDINLTSGVLTDPEELSENVSLKTLRKFDLATRMLEIAMTDLSYIIPPKNQLDAVIGKGRHRRKQDALIWIFNLNPRHARLTFDWVCEELDQDPEVYRRVIAKNCRTDLKVIVRVLVSMLGFKKAKQCADKLYEYLDLTGWHYN